MKYLLIAFSLMLIGCDNDYQQDRTLTVDYDRTTWLVVIDGDTTYSNAQIYTSDLSDGPHDLTLIKTGHRGWVKLSVMPDGFVMYAIDENDTLSARLN